MSMDISVWSRTPPNLPNDLPESAGWIRDEYEAHPYYTFEADSWQISVGSARRQSNSSPVKLDPLLEYCSHISLAPIAASNEGYAFLERVVRTLTKASDGYWESPGDGRFNRYDQGGPFL
jgi:hypothetical protein